MPMSPRSGWRADIMTAKSISRIAIALVAILATGGIVFAIQYFHRGPPADASTAPATTTDAKPAAPNQKQAALAAAQSATDALVSSLGGASPLPPQSNDGVPTFDVARVEPSGDAVIAGRRRRVRRWNCCAMASHTIAPSPISPVNLLWWYRGFRQAPTT
jgi:hypothetical protein